jgi:translation initiation factor 2 alpha subunit (eIF-2alpha)
MSASALSKEPRQFYPEALPPVGKIIIATIVRITDTAVYCELPAYRDATAMIPLSEIYIKRHKRVSDYVKEGQAVAAQVLRHDPMDLSMKIVREAEREAALAAHGRDAKIHQIARVAAEGSASHLEELLREHVWPRGCLSDSSARSCFEKDSGGDDTYNGEAVMAWMQAVRGERAAGIPVSLLNAIMTGLPEPIVSITKEVVLRFGTFHDGVARLNAALGELSTIPGLSVVVSAPPKYQLVATGPSATAANAILAVAMERIPAAC